MFTFPITAKTAGGAAKQLYRHLLHICKELEQDDDAVVLRRPGEGEWTRGWEVCWEEGPYEWAIIATGPGDIYEEELYGTLYQRPATFPGLVSEGAKWYAEPGWSFSLGFINK